VVSYLPAASGAYVGSPSIAALPGGDYVASHDHFGPRTREHAQALTWVFRSADRGATWRRVAEVRGQFWSTLFVHRAALWLLGTDRHYGDVVIRRSDDGGATWTTPTDARHGLLLGGGQYHCAPVPVLAHAGRLWRAIERRDPPTGWGLHFRAGMLSAPEHADLLDARAWTASNFLPGDGAWLDGTFGGWLEGNAVVAPDGRLRNVLRVESGYPERAAVVDISADGTRASFDPATGFVSLPGGAKKFTIRHDPPNGRYWTIVSSVPAEQQAGTWPGQTRNTLALAASPDLRAWTIECVLLAHPDAKRHGFQYVDWLFDGDDLIAICRTAYDDEAGGAHNHHDANYLTFHRVTAFRAPSNQGRQP
jgi:hypothetical protein